VDGDPDMEMVFCRGCGKEIHRTATSCPHCGARQRSGSRKSKTVAGILALFLGGLGIHRFYLGQWIGLLYLLFCWTFIPSIIAFVEAIVFFVTSEEAWDQKYG
jgi:TM2 domain-containing membrane protein YozV